MRSPWPYLAGGAALLAPFGFAPAFAQDTLTVAEARASLLGRWEGLYERLDSDAASEAFSWPIAVSIEDAGDGRTYIERVQFEGMEDDGALQVTVSILDHDGQTEHGTQFTSGTLPAPRSISLTLADARDPAHWTLEGLAELAENGQPMHARYVFKRDGDTLVSTFELDPPGDEPPFGTTRRTLRRVAPGS
ncbi:MAG TPA: hypothetical protein VI168_01660 [Croceibacterium sp.]